MSVNAADNALAPFQAMIGNIGQHRTSKDIKLQIIDKIFRRDICLGFLPFYDISHFKDQYLQTEGEILEYLPKDKGKQYYQNYKFYQNALSIGFWSVSFLLFAFCHKIKFISNLLGTGTWKMLAFKISFIALPTYFYLNFNEDVEQQALKEVYERSKNNYRMYRRSDDILDLNPDLQLTGKGLFDKEEEQRQE